MLSRPLHAVRRVRAALLVGLVLAGPAASADGPSTAKVGKKIDNLTFPDAAGKAWSLHANQTAKATVLVFLSFDCPVCTSYARPLADLAKAYQERGVTFIGLVATEDHDEQVRKLAADFNLGFPIFSDRNLKAADALKAEITPEAFVLDREFVLRYRGRIDDTYAARLKRNAKTTRYDLRQALDELLAGKPVSQVATQAVGCPIPRRAAVAVDGPVTFHRDVEPILQRRCQACHRPNGAAPFALLTYRHAVNWAEDIAEYTRTRQMPPWKPTAGAFRDERMLTDREIATLAEWVRGGKPAGNPKDAPPPRVFEGGWQLGTPDLIITMDEEMQLGPTGPDHFRWISFPVNLPEDRYVTAVEVRPGTPRVVHHAVMFVDPSGRTRHLQEEAKKKPVPPDQLDRGPGVEGVMGVGLGRGGRPRPSQPPQGNPQPGQPNPAQPPRRPPGAFGLPGLLAVWAPGQRPRHTPDGTGYLLPKGADVVVQMHYNRSGKVEKDRTSFGLYFAKRPVEKRIQDLPVFAFFPFILPGSERHRVSGTVYVDTDCHLHSIFPHMHLIGKEITVTMTPPGGEKQTLLTIRDWDFNWQETYFFRQPLAVKAGTRFDIEGTYDNSSKNPRNPSRPPRLVIFGMQTQDEMCAALLSATPDKPGRISVRLNVNRPQP